MQCVAWATEHNVKQSAMEKKKKQQNNLSAKYMAEKSTLMGE